MNTVDAMKEAARYEAINELLVKYPDGFQVNNMLEEHADLFKSRCSSTRFLSQLEEENKLLHVRRNHRQHYYTEIVDVYQMLTELWHG